jgi:hypothetical protein
MARTHQGVFKVKNRHKYVGNPDNVVYRSNWELKCMMNLDHSPKVKRWSSEELSIPYYFGMTGRRHRYYPDFFVEYVDGTKELWEIKPHKQTRPPKLPANRKATRKTLNEITTYERNKAKWKAAHEWCERNDVVFKILTEKELFRKN